MAEDYKAGTYVLTVGKFTTAEGDEYSYGDPIDLEDEKEVKRLVTSGSVAASDTTEGRKARAEATGDPVERNNLIAEEKEATAERLLAEAEALRGGQEHGDKVADEARSASESVSTGGGEALDNQTTDNEDEE